MNEIIGAAAGVIVGDETYEVEAWARRIGGAWQKSIDAIFETGRLISEAKAALPHGAFGKMIANDLPFGADAAQRLMAIAADTKLTNAEHVRHLPPSWGTLYELSKLDTETFTRRIKEGTIRPDMLRREVKTGGARSIMASREQSRESLDYFPTPPWATRALMNDVLPRLGIDPRRLGVVAEPCCGEGHMSGVLQEYGLNVRASDIGDYSRDGRYPPGWVGQADYLQSDEEADWTIFNPPFGDVTLAFVIDALRRSKRGVAAFVRQQWLEGVERYQALFGERPPTLYAQFAERVALCEGKWDPYGSTATAYCWLVWVHDMAPQPPMWIPPGRKNAYFEGKADIERFTAHPVMPFKRQLAPFATTTQTDAIIREAYGADVVDFPATISRLANEAGVEATNIHIRRRANRLGLGDRDRQREAVRKSNSARAGQ
ncbi:MAG TPA: hypothetical protein VN036_00585 [Devosia sp.]|nr:hypothetical protein [Devosia sp.]